MESRVTVILVCFNHENYVAGAIRSVLEQDLKDLELIVVDDASRDNSREIISTILLTYPDIKTVFLDQNVGNCRAFNHGFKLSTGNFIIDLAADDEFLPGKLKAQLKAFDEAGSACGVVHTDVRYIDDRGNIIGTHSEKVRKLGKYRYPPQGDVFRDILANYFVSSPSMMIRREVLEELGGYDESLAYEDFDFWVRSSRNWEYSYIPVVTMTVRKLAGGMSANMYGKGDPKVPSTLRVVRKAAQLVGTDEEKEALLSRIRYEMRMAWKYGNKPMLREWKQAYRELGGRNIFYKLLL